MNTLIWIVCATFLAWCILGVILKTRTPFREVLHRTGARLRPVPPPPKHKRFDLEV